MIRGHDESLRGNLLTVLASLVLIVTESTVQSSQLTKLVTLELVLAFGNRSGLGRVCQLLKRFQVQRAHVRLTVSMTL